MNRRLVVMLLAAWITIASSPVLVLAQEVEVSTAELFDVGRKAQPPPGDTITLAEAVRLTIRRQPRIRLAAQAVRLARGLYEGERGLFDMTLRAGSSIEYDQRPVLPSLLEAEQLKRRALDFVADGFTELHAQIRDVSSGATTGAPPPCPFRIDPDTGAILLAFPLETERPERSLTFDLMQPLEAALRGNEELPLDLRIEFEDPLSGFRNLCSDLELSIEQSNLARLAGDLGLQGVLISAREISREVFPMLSELSESVAIRTRLAFERMGPLPEDQFRRTFSLSGSVTKPFRNGLVLQGSLLLQSDEQNYKDKILDPSFGSMGFRPRFPSQASVALDLPLGKGFGAAAVAGPERAAGFTAAAREEQMRHTVAEEVYRTTLAYFNVMAAQESLRVLEESADRQEQYVTLTEQLVNADERPQIDLTRARARAASLASSVRAARTDLVAARVSLSEAAGLDAATLDEAPLASEAFGELRQTLPALDDLLQLAAARRRDTRALEHLGEASDALVGAARANQRRTFTVNVRGGFSNLYQSPFPRFFPDEEDPIFSDIEPVPERESPARYYSPRGFFRSFTGRWEPFVTAELTVNFPFGNNAAKGRLAQAEATRRSTRIQLGDTERVTRQNVVEVSRSLRETADAVERYQEAVEHMLETRDGSRELFEAGEVTLIDALLTEDEAQRDQLALVRQLQLYFSTLARLKFEAGEIVSFANEGTAAETVRFSATDFVNR